jgi:HPt (histidine-containing phosphotransfer) domain-containing protein
MPFTKVGTSPWLPGSPDEPAPETDSLHATEFDASELIDRLMGDRALAKRLARVFVDNVPRDLLALSNAISQSDSPAIAFAAHTIKGAAANIGGVAVSDAAAKLEQLGKAGSVEAAALALPELEVSLQALRSAIHGFCDSTSRS